MVDWFFVSAWLERNDTEIHFEIANEDGEQFYFWLSTELVNNKIKKSDGSALDQFHYVEEDMLSLALAILDDEIIESDDQVEITELLFDKYF